jgi:hypothetical protein
LREEHRLKVFENRVFRRIFGPKKRKTDRGENCIMMNVIACIHLIVKVIKTGRMRWTGHVVCRRRGEVFTGF